MLSSVTVRVWEVRVTITTQEAPRFRQHVTVGGRVTWGVGVRPCVWVVEVTVISVTPLDRR